MSVEITSSFNQIQGREVPGVLSAQTISFAQSNTFFQLVAAKNARVSQLREVFSKIGFSRLILSANISGFDCQVPGCTVEYLEKGFFSIADELTTAAKRARLEGAIVIVNNNDIGRDLAAYAHFYETCPRTIFVAWDWDNHHWLDLSSFFAAHSDLYVPVHHENLYLLSRYNWLSAGPVYATTVQWSRKFLTENLPLILSNPRSNDPLGKHIPYAAFPFRNQVVSTLNQTYPSIGFSDHTFHARTPMERLVEWVSHKVHWIAPVLNDVGIRVSDALCTGGIPILPESMRFLPFIRDIPTNAILFCSPHDILNPRPLIHKAVALFDSGGPDQLIARHRFGIDCLHGDRSMRDIHKFVTAAFTP